jgi:choline dehydrogenase
VHSVDWDSIFTTVWDFVVVGAGSAGCVVADRLSASGLRSVLVIEAGPQDTPLMKQYASSWYFDLSRYEWGYWSDPDPSRANRIEQWRRGRVIGGTSSINGMVYARGAHADFDRWAAMGNTGWSADDVMPLYQALERCEPGFRVEPNYSIRGRDGPLSIREVRNCHPLTDAFVKATQTLGVPYNPDYNGKTQEGVGYGQFNQRRGMRRSSADVFLKPAMKRKNLRVMTDALVHNFLIDKGRVTGVRVEPSGAAVRVVKAHNVILCGGAINTPKIMMLSGIGSPSHLRDHGISVVLDRQAVGQNMIEHPLIRPTYRAKKPSYNPTEGALQKLGFLAKFLLSGQGPIATPMEAEAFLRTSPSEPSPDVQFHFCAVGIVYTTNAKDAHKGLTVLPFPSCSVFISKSYPKSRGEVVLASADPHANPVIRPNLLGDERDVQTLVRSIGLLRRIMSAPPMADLLTQEVEPGPTSTSDNELVDYVKGRTGLSYHPIGTCRMGTDEHAVVSPDLRVRGVDNLWIADASIMPDHISGNTNGVCMLIGEKLGRQLKNH